MFHEIYSANSNYLFSADASMPSLNESKDTTPMPSPRDSGDNDSDWDTWDAMSSPRKRKRRRRSDSDLYRTKRQMPMPSKGDRNPFDTEEAVYGNKSFYRDNNSRMEADVLKVHHRREKRFGLGKSFK